MAADDPSPDGPLGAAIAIIGMAAVLPGAPDLATYRANLHAGFDAITDVPASRWDHEFYDPVAAKTRPGDRMYCRRGGFIDEVAFSPLQFGIMPNAVADIEGEQLIALNTAAAAIADAGGAQRLGDPAKIGIVLGRGGYFNAGMARFVDRVRTANQLTRTLRELMPALDEERLEQVRLAFTEQLGPMRTESGIDLMVPNLVASRTANRLDLAGPAYTIDAACASSLIAVDQAVADLKSGRCDVVLAGGVHHCHDITFWSGFNLLGALSASERIRPFHAGADGILIGEGTGIVVLKRMADVTSEDRVYAVIRGTGVAGDGRSASLMAPQAKGQVAAMRAAWAAAGLDPRAPGSVGLIEAHGTATVAGDATELASLTEIFGPALASGTDVGLGSVKSMIGHAMPAAGVAGLIKAALAVHEGVLLPTLHCEDPHPAMAGTRFAPVRALAPWPQGIARRAGVNAFGFGGINAHVVLEAPSTSRTRAPTSRTSEAAVAIAATPWDAMAYGERVLLLAGADVASIAAALDVPDAELLARDDALHPPLDGAVRLALVAPDAKRLALARKVVAQGKAWRGRNDVWLSIAPLLRPGSDGSPAGRVAFLFPGLEEVFEPRVDDVAAHFGLPPVRSDADAGLGRRGLELAAVGRLLDSALRAIDIHPDVVAGHSIGEWSALIAAGGAPFEEFADSTRAFDAGPGVPDLVFAVLGCGAALALEVIADLPKVVLSHDNCPHQAIVCGEEPEVALVLERLRGRGVSGSVLPFRSGFHTKYLEPFLGPTRDFIAGLTLRQVQVPLWSCTTAARYPDDDAAVRDLLVRNLLEPVRFGPLIEALHHDGVRAFVQVGTGSLPGFVEDTLDSPQTPYLCVSANAPKRTGMAQLRRVAAALWAEGAQPRFSRLLDDSTASAGHPSSGPPPASTAPRAGSTLTLALGAPLVRLTDPRALAAPTGSGLTSVPGDPVAEAAPSAPSERPHLPSDDPVLAGLADLLAEGEAAAGAVLAAWESRPQAGAIATPRPRATPRGSRQHTTHRVMSLASDPHLGDHALLQAPDGALPAARFPIVPMTATIAMIVEAARALIGERVVVGVRGIRAIRPIAVEPEITVIIDAEEKASDPDNSELTVVSVNVDGRSSTPTGLGPRQTYARATVLLADTYPDPPALREGPLSAERAPAVNARQMYADRWMFHGPAYQGVCEISAIADDGVRGAVLNLAAPGALLDAAGQLLGYWVAIQPQNALVLPATIGSVSFYAPDPAHDARFDVVVRLREVTTDEASADLDLRDAAGRLWCHITGWTDRRLEGDQVTAEAFRRPATAALAAPQEGGWHLLIEPWTDPTARELAARQYLTPGEQDDLAARNPRAARHWLLGRIAAKDAVRAQLKAGGAGPVYPTAIHIDNDAQGAPLVTGPGVENLTLSLAHSGTLAVALVGVDERVGIDVELIADAPAEAALLTPAERTLLDGICPAGAPERAAWVTRFWCAKEAVAKAEGTGLGGRPARFVVTRVDKDRLLVVVEGVARWVSTRSAADPVAFAVGWTRGSGILGPDLGP
ncbi:MAG: beta-ketoacyl synthase N-terminal-like domain-containing protein [Sporichthyaceae bacterium]